MIFRKSILFFLFFLFISCCVAQEQADIVQNDEYELRSFDEEKVSAFQQDKQFEYEKSNTSFIDWIKNFLKKIFSKTEKVAVKHDKTWAKIVGLIIIIVIGIVLLIILIKVLGKSSISGFFSGKGYKSKIDVEVNEINIHSFPFDKEIQTAEENKLYSIALRYRYLQTLKKLEDQELIAWRLNKTNYEYLRELSNSPYQNDFKIITRIFEYSWYGQYEMDKEQYDFHREMMINFNNRLEKNTVSLPQ